MYWLCGGRKKKLGGGSDCPLSVSGRTHHGCAERIDIRPCGDGRMYVYVRDAPTQHMKCHAPLPVCLSASFAADVHALRAPVTGQLAVVLALLLAVPTARSLTGGRCH